MIAHEHRPIIITLQLGAKSARFFQEQREKHFPAQINYIGAHLTLFHNLPGIQFEGILESVGRCCAARGSFYLKVACLLRLGRGVAYEIQSDPLMAVHAELADCFKPWLTGQDKERFHPHITVQNKVPVHEAQALFEHLAADFEPFTAKAEGLQLWHYEGGRGHVGNWAPAGAIAFQG